MPTPHYCTFSGIWAKLTIKDSNDWKNRWQGGYFNSVDDAQDVLLAIQNKSAKILGKTKEGHFLIQYRGGKGFNNNHRAGYVDQPTDKYLVKGTTAHSASVVPTSPTRAPDILHHSE